MNPSYTVSDFPLISALVRSRPDAPSTPPQTVVGLAETLLSMRNVPPAAEVPATPDPPSATAVVQANQQSSLYQQLVIKAKQELGLECPMLTTQDRHQAAWEIAGTILDRCLRDVPTELRLFNVAICRLALKGKNKDKRYLSVDVAAWSPVSPPPLLPAKPPLTKDGWDPGDPLGTGQRDPDFAAAAMAFNWTCRLPNR